MDPYAILGLNPTATPDDIKRAWRRLARVHHPDRNGGNQAMMAQINLAYNLLMDEAARFNYDQGIGEGRPPVDVRARQAIMQFVLAALTSQPQQNAWGSAEAEHDVHRFVIDHFALNEGNFRKAIKDCERTLARIQRQRKKMLFREPGNPIEMTFDQVEGQMKEAVQKNQEDLDTMVRGLELYREMIIEDSEAKAQAALKASPKGLVDNRPRPSLP